MTATNGTITARHAERALAKVAKLDAEIGTLHDRLESKLIERRTLLAALIQDGEHLRGEVAEHVRSVTHAASIAATGRLLTDDQVREIRRLWAQGRSQSALGRQFGLSQPSIYKIVRGLSYQDVK
jgi:sigma54-dependent transcription regulator